MRRGVALAGCSTGNDAVAQGGTFEFVAPGGKTDIFYDPPESRGRPGPLSGPDLMDPAKTISLDDFAGKVVVINVWGQWCGPCRTEITQLQKVYDATRDKGVAFLGIDVRDNNREAATDFIVDRKITFPSIYDPPMRTMIAFGGRYPTTVIPSTVVLDREHRVAAVFLRELLAEDLQPVVERLASESAGAPDKAWHVTLNEVGELMASGPVAAGVPRQRARRAGVVRLSLRGAARARLSVVPRRGRRCGGPARIPRLAQTDISAEKFERIPPNVDFDEPPRTAARRGRRIAVRRRIHRGVRARHRRGAGNDDDADHQPASAATYRRSDHDRDGSGFRRASSPCCNATPGLHHASSPRLAALHCSARCSRSAGRRAWGRR